MKRLSLLSILLSIIVGGFSLLPVSAQAVSPSPTADCAKVKAKILNYQAQERIFAKEYAPVNGKWSWFFSSAHLNDKWNLQKKIVDFEVVLFTFDMANISCFNLRQQSYIKLSYKKWKDRQRFLNGKLDWLQGFTFTSIAWDSVYAKDLITSNP